MALVPVAFAVNPDDPEAASAQFESLIEGKLREIGFTVVASKVYKETWERLSKQVGGVFDPITGKRDDAKIKTLRGYMLEELRTGHRADAVLHPVVQIVKAGFSAGYARWHGAVEPVIPEGFWARFAVGDTQGTTSALSLYITVEDTNGVNLYIQAGGIQVLTKLTTGRQFVPIPQRELLTNAERNKAAVDIALRALSQDGPTESSNPSAP